MTPAIRTQLRPGYAPSKSPLTDAKAIEAFEKALRATNIYHNAKSYCRGRTCKYIIFTVCCILHAHEVSSTNPPYMHYSFDFAQQIHFPYSSQQLGELFFRTLRK